jgi:hypothetical protein
VLVFCAGAVMGNEAVEKRVAKNRSCLRNLYMDLIHFYAFENSQKNLQRTFPQPLEVIAGPEIGC